jgi:hypothetical protein
MKSVNSIQEPAEMPALFDLMGVIKIPAGAPFPEQEINSNDWQASGAHV